MRLFMKVLRRLREKFPEFVRDCETKGVHYHAYMGAESDASKGVGRSWKSFFGLDFMWPKHNK